MAEQTRPEQFLESISGRLERGARSLYGEPIRVDGHTLVPVSSVSYGFGGGGGTQPARGSEDTQSGTGGGGGVRAVPVGVFDVTEKRTRFVPVVRYRRLAVVFGAGVLVGVILGRRRR